MRVYSDASDYYSFNDGLRCQTCAGWQFSKSEETFGFHEWVDVFLCIACGDEIVRRSHRQKRTILQKKNLVKANHQAAKLKDVGWQPGGSVPGFTNKLVREMLVRQDYKCAVCKTEFEARHGSMQKMHRDHCHLTLKPRGLLCAACNFALGFYEKVQRPAGMLISQYEAYLGDE